MSGKKHKHGASPREQQIGLLKKKIQDAVNAGQKPNKTWVEQLIGLLHRANRGKLRELSRGPR